MFNRPGTILGSGMFLCEQLYSQPVNITSPYIKPAALEKVDGAVGQETSGFVVRTRESPNVFPVYQPTLVTYAGKLVEVARIFKEGAYDIVLCPMRGARMPGMQADLVCQTEPFRPFDGSDMAQRFNDERILTDLCRLIRDVAKAGEQRQIGVLDTAVGGDSCRHMARLLRQLNDEGKEQWGVTFHLVHADGRVPPRASEAYSYGNRQFIVAIHYHGVTHLLIEDEARLLGYDVIRGGGQSHIVPYQKDGQILLYGPDGATLYRKAPLDESMLALVSREMMNLILTMPDIKPVNLDHWPYGP